MKARIIFFLAISVLISTSITGQATHPAYQPENDPSCKPNGDKTECDFTKESPPLPSYYPPSPTLEKMYEEERERMREEEQHSSYPDVDRPDNINSENGRDWRREYDANFQRYSRSRTRDFWIRNGDQYKKITTSAVKKGLKEVIETIGNKIVHLPALDLFWTSDIALDNSERLYLLWDVQTLVMEVNFMILGTVYYELATTEERDQLDQLYKDAEYESLDRLSKKIYEERGRSTSVQNSIHEGPPPPTNNLPPGVIIKSQ